jgi:hypothetical protein
MEIKSVQEKGIKDSGSEKGKVWMRERDRAWK